jgi:hypothetical protein
MVRRWVAAGGPEGRGSGTPPPLPLIAADSDSDSEQSSGTGTETETDADAGYESNCQPNQITPAISLARIRRLIRMVGLKKWASLREALSKEEIHGCVL